ncbi:MAG: GNAT family protein [Pseudomonadota bacterium]
MTVSELPVVIETSRFLLRELTGDDVSARYLGWLGDSAAQKWIATAESTRELAALREYVQQRVGRRDVLFLGIFAKTDDLHIGNIKYEPLLQEEGRAELGVLIGDPAFRGKRVFAEVLAASAEWLKSHRNIRRIYLGVERQNLPAVTAYQNAGFVAEPSLQQAHAPGVLRMVLHV